MTPQLVEKRDMAQAVKISDQEMDAVREAAQLHNRSISGQAEHWIRLGRAVERDPRFGIVQIEEALRGLRPVGSLDEEQQDEYFQRFADETLTPSASEEAFWADRRKRGVGVGLDDAGNLVIGH